MFETDQILLAPLTPKSNDTGQTGKSLTDKPSCRRLFFYKLENRFFHTVHPEQLPLPLLLQVTLPPPFSPDQLPLRSLSAKNRPSRDDSQTGQNKIHRIRQGKAGQGGPNISPADGEKQTTKQLQSTRDHPNSLDEAKSCLKETELWDCLKRLTPTEPPAENRHYPLLSYLQDVTCVHGFQVLQAVTHAGVGFGDAVVLSYFCSPLSNVSPITCN